jgi:hypothetical protein
MSKVGGEPRWGILSELYESNADLYTYGPFYLDHIPINNSKKSSYIFYSGASTQL